MDTFFISHGSPTLAIDENLPSRLFLQSWRSKIMQETPKAILMVSAHWDTDTPTVNLVHSLNDTIYDFHDFPRAMYELKYPAPGAPDLAKRVKELLDKSGFGPIKEEKNRGLDHGAWVPLMSMYPEPTVPVCQLSIQTKNNALHHYKMGEALAPLRDEGILVIGSGGAIHNLQAIGPDNGPVSKWASDFATWLKESLLNGRHDDVNKYEEKGPNAKMAHPTPEHLLPLHVALGVAGPDAKGELIHDSWANCTFSFASYRFTTSNRK